MTPGSHNAEARRFVHAPRVALSCVIVDDNREFLASATTLLETQGVRVQAVATDVASGVAAAADARPDVVLVDVELGGESGLDVVRALQAAGLTAPVILISTHAQDDVADLLAEAPDAGFVPKSRLGRASIEAALSLRRET
jgi:DNA-binding NarL/FixJ family response regulator